MPGGKVVFVDLRKWERGPSRAAEDNTRGSGPSSETAWRWQALAGALEGQDNMGCSKASGDSLQMGQEVGSSLSHDGWALR